MRVRRAEVRRGKMPGTEMRCTAYMAAKAAGMSAKAARVSAATATRVSTTAAAGFCHTGRTADAKREPDENDAGYGLSRDCPGREAGSSPAVSPQITGAQIGSLMRLG